MCKAQRPATPIEKSSLEKVLAGISPKAEVTVLAPDFIFEPNGCEHCKQLGYRGRTTISEVLVVDREIEELIIAGASASQIRDKAVENGMLTMEQDGMLKVLEGETTLEEVERVV